jgi:hypothetical protein
MSKERESSSGTPATDVHAAAAPGAVFGFHGVRYLVNDVARSVAFYTTGTPSNCSSLRARTYLAGGRRLSL